MDFKKVQELFDIELPTDEFETLSGFVIGQLRRIPSDDEQPEVTFGNLVFVVQHVEENRVSEVLVRVVADAELDVDTEAEMEN